MSSLIELRVPERIGHALQQRAAARGESLNTYLLRILEREVTRPGGASVPVFTEPERMDAESFEELVRQIHED